MNTLLLPGLQSAVLCSPFKGQVRIQEKERGREVHTQMRNSTVPYKYDSKFKNLELF